MFLFSDLADPRSSEDATNLHGLFGAIFDTIVSDGSANGWNNITGARRYETLIERFFNRFERLPVVHKIFDSKVHGDPATPLLSAYIVERIIIRLLMPGDKPRNISFLVHGHAWYTQLDNPLSNLVAIQGAISAGNTFNLELSKEPKNCAGDYFYRSGSLRWDVESGMWGILRLKRRTLRYHCENVCRCARKCWEKVRHEK